MPQGRPTSKDYENDHIRTVAEKPNRVLLSIRPMTEGDARKFVGACNKVGADKRVTEYFVAHAKRLQD